MAYDASVDQELFSKAWENDAMKLVVGIYSYKGGAKKVQIRREPKGEEGRASFAKLGRLTKEELQGILPLLQEALGQLG
ncbi:MAG: hypothetical protein HYY15_01200 [Candidatus Omnitrophica bacterium]|nr:hypothetical protein [Candidatus Omnitrophota bacterium]